MVFQSYALYPHMTVAENLAFSLKLAKVPPAEAQARIARASQRWNWAPNWAGAPPSFQGGQRQRVGDGACHRARAAGVSL